MNSRSNADRMITDGTVNVEVDIQRGAEILSIVDRVTGLSILANTPWGSQPRAATHAPAFPTISSRDAWMRSYRGGWQVLFPHAGEQEQVDGLQRQYHGEASLVPWQLMDRTTERIRASVQLYTVPVTMVRTIEVSNSTITVTDELTNDSDQVVHADIVHHIAFGAEFAAGSVIETDALRWTAAGGDEFELRASQAWPFVRNTAGKSVDLSAIPRNDERISRFGWLESFPTPEIRVHNLKHELIARVLWDDPDLVYAWFWQEVHGSREFPWYGRGYAVGLEPASRPPGPGGPRVQLGPGAVRTVTLSLRLEHDRTIGSV